LQQFATPGITSCSLMMPTYKRQLTAEKKGYTPIKPELTSTKRITLWVKAKYLPKSLIFPRVSAFVGCYQLFYGLSIVRY